MDYVDGWSPMSTGARGEAPFDADLDARAELGREIVRGIARLGAVDWRAAGLEGFGQPDGFHERQVPRWMSLYEKVAFRDVPESGRPPDGSRRVRHGSGSPGSSTVTTRSPT